MTVYLIDGIKLTGQDESDYNNGVGVYAGIPMMHKTRDRSKEPINKLAAAYTFLTCVGILGWGASVVLAIVLDGFYGGTVGIVFTCVALAPVAIVVGFLVIGFLWVPIEGIYDIYNKEK